MRIRAFAATLIITFVSSPYISSSHASEDIPRPTIGTQEVGLTAGYLIPHLLKKSSETEQSGPALMPTWMITLTDPIGGGWYRGQVSLGLEMAYIQFQEPTLTHGIGFSPRIKYTFVAGNRIRPYVEFAGGPFWTDLSNKIPEQSSEFNFILNGGLGCSFFINSQTSINVGYRFQHISNAYTSRPNVGLNSSLPFGGFSFYY